MTEYYIESTGKTCGKCGNEPGQLYDGDLGDYFCSDCYDKLQTLIENGYSVTDWLIEL